MPNAHSALVVDGHAPDRVKTTKLLEDAGYRVYSAGDFDEAKAVLDAESPAVLVTDVRLGQYNGLHLVLRSQAAHPQMGAVVTSRVADPVLEAEAHKQHAQFVLHPFNSEQLLEAVNASLEEVRSRAQEPPRQMAEGPQFC